MGLQHKAAGKAISGQRDRLDLTQAEVVAALQGRGVDISLSTYQRLEYGQTLKPFLDMKFVAELALLFETTPNELRALVGLVEQQEVLIDAGMQSIVALYNESDPETRKAFVESSRILLKGMQRKKEQK